MSAQQNQAAQVLQQLLDMFFRGVFSYPLLGLVLFIGLLWFFHEFREWRMATSLLASLGITLLIMLVFTPVFSPFIHLFGL